MNDTPSSRQLLAWRDGVAYFHGVRVDHRIAHVAGSRRLNSRRHHPLSPGTQQSHQTITPQKKSSQVARQC
jgi:hypothetical protein